MTESTNKRSNITNLLIIGVAIILICNIKTRFCDPFVAQVPMIPNDNGYGAQGGGFYGYNSGNPYAFNQLGRPCSNGDCGELGKCENGTCRAIH